MIFLQIMKQILIYPPLHDECRQCVTEFRQLINIQRNILDGDLLWRYLSLSLSERLEIAKRIGTNMDQVIIGWKTPTKTWAAPAGLIMISLKRPDSLMYQADTIFLIFRLFPWQVLVPLKCGI